MEKVYHSIGGIDINVILAFPDDVGGLSSPYVFLGSAITVSYSVHRAKSPVFNLGESTVSGFSIGKKTVAGSIIKAVMEDDELEEFLLEKLPKMQSIKKDKEVVSVTKLSYSKDSSSIMKDDLLPFNIILVFSSEYKQVEREEVIYGCNVISNGKVLSAMDLFTEDQISFVAKDVRQVGEVKAEQVGLMNSVNEGNVKTISSLFTRKGG